MEIFSKKIQYFLMCANERSVRGAARRLGVTPAALSTAISGLEKELALELFHRNNRGLTLTEKGAALYGALSSRQQQEGCPCGH